MGDRLNLFYIFVLIFTISGCSVYGPWVNKKSFEEYKTLHSFEHLNVNNGILFNEDKIDTYKEASERAAEATNKKYEKELAELTSFYFMLDEDMIDYLWYKDKIFRIR